MEKTDRIACSLQSVSNAALCEGEEETRKAYTGTTVIPNATTRGNQQIYHLYPLPSGRDARTCTILLRRRGITANTG
jgi:hypothetical protein